MKKDIYDVNNKDDIMTYAKNELHMWTHSLDVPEDELIKHSESDVKEYKNYLEKLTPALLRVEAGALQLLEYGLNELNINIDELRLAFEFANDTLSFKPICDIRGEDPDEWDDITTDEVRDKILKVNYEPVDGEIFSIDIKIESVERNKRYPQIIRYNKDNDYANIPNMLTFIDEKGEAYNSSKSMRFIKLPWQFVSGVTVPPEVPEPEKYVDKVSAYLPGFPLPQSAMKKYEEEKNKPHHLKDEEDK